MSLYGRSRNLSGHSQVARDLNKFILLLTSCTQALNKFVEPLVNASALFGVLVKCATHEEHTYSV